MIKRIYLYAYVLMLLTMIVLPYYSAENYSIVQNSTSQLGAQLTRNAWIMNGVFILMGASTFVYGWVKLSGFPFQKGLIAIFGLALMGSGIFNHAPLDLTLAYSVVEDHWHSVLATITGFSFVIYATSCIFIVNNKREKVIAFSNGIFALILSFSIFAIDDYKGVFQRIMFAVAFAWLYAFLSKFKTNAIDCE